MHLWRRSYEVAPPGGESLKDTVARALPYYLEEILPRVLRGERILLVAHGNSLRSLLMALDRLTPETLPHAEIATGAALIYRLNAGSSVESKELLKSCDTDLRVPARAPTTMASCMCHIEATIAARPPCFSPCMPNTGKPFSVNSRNWQALASDPGV